MDISMTTWALTIVGLSALIAVDFFIGGRKPHEVSLKEAGIWTTVWIVLAALFGLGLFLFGNGQVSGEFFAGFITEKSLSVDNLFVFVLIMAKFAVPSIYQQRVLMVGVLIALVLRGVFIAAGAAIISTFSWVFFLFGAFLIWTAWKLVQEARSDDEEEFEENRLLKAVERRFPSTDKYHGTKLFVVENGKRLMTPMLIVMLAIGTTDVLFALDSIPAIFGLTQDPYIVFTANAFALMGLRQLYFLIGGLLQKLVHLSYGLSIILGFIGVKLVLHALHETGVHVPEISIPVSLGVICAVLVITTLTSLAASRKQARAAAEAEREERTRTGP
ncbi:TerC family protein [Streptomyces qinglanensis]|uniref:Tellurite resistance protein TerC n=1 Tax=Streptomyces qinglanensis TaxID=943816 RepID=A0A1H9N638_9ACTN|nr:TerC family protein [Streptomyces qinglanensis]SER31384.1 tellurite resistance protein TerC [Streptomyces qinglanensis]